MRKPAKTEAKTVYKDAVKEIRRLITRAKQRERDHRASIRWNIKHAQYTNAATNLVWAQQQEAFREGLETALVNLGEKK